MAKATLKYDLDDLDDELEFKMASHSKDVFIAIFNAMQDIKRLADSDDTSEDASDALYKAMDKLSSHMEVNGIDLNWLR